jgi:hypothetical protein
LFGYRSRVLFCFGIEPRHGIGMFGFPEEVAAQIETEEQLDNLLGIEVTN